MQGRAEMRAGLAACGVMVDAVRNRTSRFIQGSAVANRTYRIGFEGFHTVNVLVGSSR